MKVFAIRAAGSRSLWLKDKFAILSLDLFQRGESCFLYQNESVPHFFSLNFN